MNNKLAYPKSCVLMYTDGWYITHLPPNGVRVKIHGPYRTFALSETDREILNTKHDLGYTIKSMNHIDIEDEFKTEVN